jgi:Calx-beta domain
MNELKFPGASVAAGRRRRARWRRGVVAPAAVAVLSVVGPSWAAAPTSKTSGAAASSTSSTTSSAGSSLPRITVTDVQVAEPTGGSRAALFAVDLSAESASTVSVRFATRDGSAIAGLDYQPNTGTVTFAPGETTKTIAVNVRNDNVASSDKTFFLQLSKPSNAELDKSLGEATIIDTNRVVMLGDTQVFEPDPGGVADAIFHVNLTVPNTSGGTSGGMVDVVPNPGPGNMAVHFSTADGSAIAGVDYQPLSGTIVFRPGEGAKTIAVKVLNDHVATGDKKFSMELFDPVNAELGTPFGEATITDVDRVVSINDLSVNEPPVSGTAQATFTVFLASLGTGPETPIPNPGPGPVAVDFATVDGTAIAGREYQPVHGRLVFLPGEASKTVTVTVMNDGLAGGEKSPDKIFLVQLSQPSGAGLGRPAAQAVIVETGRLITVEDASIAKSDFGTVDATFAVTLSAPAPDRVSVDYATADGTAVAPTDYLSQRGTLVFEAGESAKIVRVTVVADPIKDGEKTFALQLSNPQAADGASLSRAQGVATIAVAKVVTPTPKGSSYWLVAADGGIFAYGDAGYFGSTGTVPLNLPIVGMAATPTGAGYWLVAADGGIFSFGDARFFGSTGNIPLQRPIVGMAATPTGAGYWLVAADGAVHGFGDAGFFGSLADIPLNFPVVGIAPARTGGGYLLANSSGGVFAFGDAVFSGSAAGLPLTQPIVGLALLR